MKIIVRDEKKNTFYTDDEAFKVMFSYFKFTTDEKNDIDFLRYKLNGKEARIYAKRTLFPQFKELKSLILKRDWKSVQSWFENVWLVRSSKRRVLLLVPKEAEKKEGIYLFSFSLNKYLPSSLYEKYSNDRGFSIVYLKEGKRLLEVSPGIINILYYNGNTVEVSSFRKIN